MSIFVPKELHPGETRTAIVPNDVARLVKLGAAVIAESGLGESSGHPDKEYSEAGAAISSNRDSSFSEADLVLRLRKPAMQEVELLPRGSIHVSFLDPFKETALVQQLADRGVSTVSMEMIPRISRAQKMDALTSQANIGGYMAVVIAAHESNKIFPMMMTAAGTLTPARVFVIGAGVAGLQAIATARRLGARVEAYDTRPVVEEQVRSLGARFLKIDVGETGQTRDGYAKQLTAEQLQKQREGMRHACGDADVVITTAQVFGRRAPRIITSDMLDAMRPGSVVVDMAVESGGNVDGSEPDQIIHRNEVRIIGFTNLAGRVPVHASQVYSANVANLVEEFWDKEAGRFVLNLDDEIIKGALITHEGRVVNEKLKESTKQ